MIDVPRGAFQRLAIKVEIFLPGRDAVIPWLEDQFWLGRHVPFLVITKVVGGCVMVHATLVKYITEAELRSVYGIYDPDLPFE